MPNTGNVLIYFCMFVSESWIVFEDAPFDLDGAVDPLLFIFPEQPVASHQKSQNEPIAAHGKLHIAGRSRAEMASGTVDGRDHLLVEADHRVGNLGGKRRGGGL